MKPEGDGNIVKVPVASLFAPAPQPSPKSAFSPTKYRENPDKPGPLEMASGPKNAGFESN
jgi:hypothetical protein